MFISSNVFDVNSKPLGVVYSRPYSFVAYTVYWKSSTDITRHGPQTPRHSLVPWKKVFWFPILKRYVTKGVFSVIRICSRTRDWPACVAPAKNNFICLFIVKRDKRMRNARPAFRMPAFPHCGALCGASPRCVASACVSVPTNSVPILESGGAHALYCTNDCQNSYAIRRKLKLETAYDPQREILRMRANPACVSKSAWH
jgi:hypothetical protein